MRLKYNTEWLILAIFLHLTNGEGFEGDPCTMNSTPGVCRLSSQCPELEMAVRMGKISVKDIVNCGYTTREEIICCPGQSNVQTDNRQTLITTTPKSSTTSTTSTTTTTAATSTDFWAHLLTTTPTPIMETTTPKPDFWLHLLNTTTSTTTPLPLVVNGKELDSDTGFIDLSQLLEQDGRRQKNSIDIAETTLPTIQSEPDATRPIPDSINDRTFGWQGPPLGMPNARTNWNAPRPRQWNTGSTHNFQTNPGMPFLDDWRNPRGGRVVWVVEQPNALIPNQRQRQPNFAWPNQQETTIPRPATNWNMQQPRTMPLEFNQLPNAGFQNPGLNTWQNPNFKREPFNEWQNGNDISPTNNFVENFGPINNAIQNQDMIEEPSPKRLPNPFIPTNLLPNHPIFPGNNVAQQQRPNNFVDDARNPIAMINDNLIKSGLEIIKAEANEIDNEYENQKLNFLESEGLTTTPRVVVSDIFAPFQFRPQPDDYEDNTNNRNQIIQQGGSNDFRFPDATKNRPAWNPNQSKKDSGDDENPPIRNSTTIAPRINDRPAVVACREIDAGLDPGISYHILGGTPVELQEFPHMAAIGYRSIGNEGGPYDYRCGGTLIAKRFVLTAAHCVNSRDSQPEVVLLGLVDINNAEQREKADEVKIRRVHIHDDYSNSRTYHDVAILELEREVVYSEFIYPTCLYTDLNDPPANTPVYVSGWGQINTGSRQKSNILLKAKLNIVPVSQCNVSYVEMGLNRRINVGVMNSQMCAHDPGFTRDACQGDSGGPLITVEDETYRKYRIIGIISAGFSCGSATPGLYTRVASYLDYIESVVWPSST